MKDNYESAGVNAFLTLNFVRINYLNSYYYADTQFDVFNVIINRSAAI